MTIPTSTPAGQADEQHGVADAPRRVFVLAHTGRASAVQAADELLEGLEAAGVIPVLLAEEASGLSLDSQSRIDIADPHDPVKDAELLVVLGGDGTILRAAEITRGTDVPLLGVNLGHVGFLAESEREDLAATVQRIAASDYEVEERMTLEVTVLLDGEVIGSTWAVNEASIEKRSREHMIDVLLEVDGRPLTAFGCDGVVIATPTGSTAYAFSAGGPVIWPEVDALLIAPISAHALFARPLVVAPTSVSAVELRSHSQGAGILWCDGRRSLLLPAGARIEVRRSGTPVRLARLSRPPFTDRLVAKFGLPVHGWRGRPRGDDPE